MTRKLILSATLATLVATAAAGTALAADGRGMGMGDRGRDGHPVFGMLPLAIVAASPCWRPGWSSVVAPPCGRRPHPLRCNLTHRRRRASSPSDSLAARSLPTTTAPRSPHSAGRRHRHPMHRGPTSPRVTR
jgi:hypothetical protein